MTTRSQTDRTVFVTRRIPEAGLALLREGGAEVIIGEEVESRLPTRATVLAGVARAPVLLPLLTETVDRELLLSAPHLRGVGDYAVGFNNIDVIAATNALDHMRGEKAPNVVNPEVYEGEAWRARVGGSDV